MASPWYEWSDAQSATVWAVQAMKITAAGLHQRGADDGATWTDFTRQLDTTFGRSDWGTNAIVQRVLYAAAEMDRNNPLRLTDEQWLYAGTMARTALETWHQDTTDLVGLAAHLGVDPVQIGWVAAPAAEQPEFARDFASYVSYYLSEGGGLPDAATIGSWFGKDLWPEAIVARFQTDFPTGVSTPDGTVLSMDEIGRFYLGAKAWEATNQLQDEEIDPKFVEEILALFQSEEPLDEAGMAKVKEAVDAGIITFEDDD
ncbi:hypothetical protein [Actinokineospora alba]|nr:hypothetical protein [Actinokineospora alba]